MKKYAVYQGDKILAIGTLKQVAEKLKVKEKTVLHYGTKSYQDRTSKNSRRVILLSDETEENREKCFADLGSECSALNIKKCNGCNFYKPISEQVKVVIKDINSYRSLLSSQLLKTLRGQAVAGDLYGAWKGLEKAKKMMGGL